MVNPPGAHANSKLPPWTRSWGLAAIPLLILIAGFFILPALWPQGRAWVFIGAMALLAALLGIIGWLVNARPMGAFIDNRNMLSLSKLQAGAWTVVVLSAFATAAAFNVHAGKIDFSVVKLLNITIPNELLLAMGISATSLVAAPSLLSLKRAEDPDPDAEAQAATRTGHTPVPDTGKLFTKAKPADASWADLVTGEELGNAGTPDLGKIQQALITLILLGAYAGYVFQFYASTPGPITGLPGLDKSFVWLMGISHASYLAYKAAPHTASADEGKS